MLLRLRRWQQLLRRGGAVGLAADGPAAGAAPDEAPREAPPRSRPRMRACSQKAHLPATPSLALGSFLIAEQFRHRASPWASKVSSAFSNKSESPPSLVAGRLRLRLLSSNPDATLGSGGGVATGDDAAWPARNAARATAASTGDANVALSPRPVSYLGNFRLPHRMASMIRWQ